MNEKSQGSDSEQQTKKLPKVGQPYWVHFEGYRRLAVLDRSGKWHAVPNGEELIGVMKVYFD
jgi:hypothetical protein